MNTIDLRPVFPPVRDQGVRGTCVAFAVTAAHEFARSAPGGSIEDLSEETLYWNCKQLDGDQQQGTSFNSASNVLQHAGQPPEAEWHYDGFRDENDGTYLPPEGALDHHICFRTMLLKVPANAQQIKDCLANGQPVILGIPTFNSFIMAPSGRVPMPAVTEAESGGHAVLVVGYDEDPVNGNWLIFRNSWGEGWGIEGYGYLPYDYIHQYIGEAWTVHQ